MATSLRALGPQSWLAELQALRLEPQAVPIELARFGLYAPDGCTALVTDRLRLELVSVSLEGPAAAWQLEIRSAGACGADWPVLGGVVGAGVRQGLLAIVDFPCTTEWSLWGSAPGAATRTTVHLRAIVEHCCASIGSYRGQLGPKPPP